MARADTRARLSRALRQAYETAGMTQTGLAEATGIDQQTISKYARGAVTPPLEAVETLEDACGLERGHILRLAGFVTDDIDIRSGIAADTSLDKPGREMVLGAYDYARRSAASIRLLGGRSARRGGSPPKTAAEFDVGEALAEWEAQPLDPPPDSVLRAEKDRASPPEEEGPARSA